MEWQLIKFEFCRWCGNHQVYRRARRFQGITSNSIGYFVVSMCKKTCNELQIVFFSPLFVFLSSFSFLVQLLLIDLPKGLSVEIGTTYKIILMFSFPKSLWPSDQEKHIIEGTKATCAKESHCWPTQIYHWIVIKISDGPDQMALLTPS